MEIPNWALKKNLALFPDCSLIPGAFSCACLAIKLTWLINEFGLCFSHFRALWLWYLFQSFHYGRIQCTLCSSNGIDSSPKWKWAESKVPGCWNQGLLPTTPPAALMPQLQLHAARVLSMFWSTYLCKQPFSVMNLNKTKHRSHLTDKNVHVVLIGLVLHDIKPDIDRLTFWKYSQTSAENK